MESQIMKRNHILTATCLLLCISVLIIDANAAPIPSIVMPQDYIAERASTYNPTGANGDNIKIPANTTVALATLEGAGIIQHCWFTINSKDPQYLSNLQLRITWDDATKPAVQSKWGPFFCLGFDECADVLSEPIAVMSSTASFIKYPPGFAAFNCYFKMPFRKKAVIEVVNSSTMPVNNFFYHINWQRHKRLPRGVHYFHAKYLEEETKVEKLPKGRNPTGENNYVILDTKGKGHFIGCSLHVEAHRSEKGKWYEGDEMILVDGQQPSEGILGTGSEDYFGMAWGVRRWFQAPYFGTSYHSWNQGERKMAHWGRFSVYRFHMPDPIPFKKSISVSIEHGHNNDAANRYQSVAYWYAEKP
jgi:D-arabinan exo alpha-(1,3)/(1,5)-arabinofuranosidase (non-reducing end)